MSTENTIYLMGKYAKGMTYVLTCRMHDTMLMNHDDDIRYYEEILLITKCSREAKATRNIKEKGRPIAFLERYDIDIYRNNEKIGQIPAPVKIKGYCEMFSEFKLE